MMHLTLFFILALSTKASSGFGYGQMDTDDSVDDIFGTFSDDFLWGTATASYQVEGGWNASFKAPSIWDTNSHACSSAFCETGDVAADSYHKWKEDIALMKAMGVNAYRLSISWPRLFYKSTPGPVDYDGFMYYNNIFDELVANNITPMVTLFHWDLPQYIQDEGGWMNPEIQDWFNYYADFCFHAFGDRVKVWYTMNEPESFIINGYQWFFQPAVEKCVSCPYAANKNVLMAHANAYHLYNRKYRAMQNGQIGFALGIEDGRPSDDKVENNAAASRYRDWNAGVYLEPLLGTGNWPQQMVDILEVRSRKMNQTNPLPRMSIAEQNYVRGTLDIFGVNIYTAELVYDKPDTVLDGSYDSDRMLGTYQDPKWPGSASSWLKMVPSAVTNILNLIAVKYNTNIPIYISECGWSNNPDDSLNDTTRINFYNAYLRKALRAYQNGINLKGFTAWSLVDNFEWKDGFTKRFGLHYVNFTDPDRPRTPKLSAKWYTSVIANNGFPKN